MSSARFEFIQCGADHRVVIVGTIMATAALVLGRRRLIGTDDEWVRRGIAAILLGNELLALGIGVAQGHARVPLHLCDLALLLTVWSLLSLNPVVSELAYFWGLAGSGQAIVTPALTMPFPTFWWWTFFIGHCGIVLSVVYLALTARVHPTLSAVWRVLGWTNLYALIAGIINGIFGTNYGFLAHKPTQPSVLDLFGPWPSYLVGMEGVALVSCVLCYAPFVMGRRQQQTATTTRSFDR